MINYLVKREFAGTMGPLLNDWSDRTGSLADRFHIIHYEDLPDMSELPAGSIIFSDVDRLSPGETKLAAAVRDRGAAQFPDVPILNDPERTLHRFDLLDLLHREDLNPFRAYRLTDTTIPEHFPVFLRYESGHYGAVGGLLADQDALDAAVVRAMIRGHRLSDLLMVEFVDAAGEDGLYRKYAAYIVGDRVIPSDVISDQDWEVKGYGIGDRALVDAELAYLAADPHASRIKQIFDLAGVGYGRIDYALIDERVVTWEINTNPFTLWTKDRQPWWSLPKLDDFIPALIDAFAAIDPELDGAVGLNDIDEDLRRSARVPVAGPDSGRARSVAARYKKVLAPAAGVVEAVAVPFRRQIIGAWRRTLS